MPIKIDDTYDINDNNTLRTSAYENTCALAAGSNLIANQLLSLTDEQAIDSPLFAWAGTFARYYQIEKSLDLSYFKALFRNYPNPRDQQLILAPVLRAYLSELIKNDADIRKKLFHADGDKTRFEKAFKDFLKDNGTYSSIFQGNQAVFNDLLVRYLEHCSKAKNTSRRHSINAQEFFAIYEEELSQLWHKVCAVQYADYIGSGKQEHYLEADEAAIVYNKLGISLTAYQPLDRNDVAKGYFAMNFPVKDEVAKLEMSIRTNHWQTCHDVESVVAMHNATFISESELEQDYAVIKSAVLAKISNDSCLSNDVDSDVESEIDPVDHVATTSEDDSDVDEDTDIAVNVVDPSTVTAAELKVSWLSNVRKAAKEAAASSIVADSKDSITYHYMDPKHGLCFFKTSAEKQDELDAKLARLLAKDENEFSNLPKL